jgi:hypothetical protein
MGILDIYGFEIFERNRWWTEIINSLIGLSSHLNYFTVILQFNFSHL